MAMFKGQVIDILAVMTRAAEEVFHNGSVSIDYIKAVEEYHVRIYEDGAVAHEGRAKSLTDAINACAWEFILSYPSFIILSGAAS